jgi:hypothetical protein
MHGFNGGDDATRCATPGQFASVAPPKEKPSAELDTARDLIVEMQCFETFHFPDS